VQGACKAPAGIAAERLGAERFEGAFDARSAREMYIFDELPGQGTCPSR
jgi:hypothetical protein